MGKRGGRVVIPAGLDIWPHELAAARALSNTGRTVEFLPRLEGGRVKSPDIQMDGVAWEIKSPKTADVRYLQRILRRAAAQSPNVIIDTSRLARVPDEAVEHELRRVAPSLSQCDASSSTTGRETSLTSPRGEVIYQQEAIARGGSSYRNASFSFRTLKTASAGTSRRRNPADRPTQQPYSPQ